MGNLSDFHPKSNNVSYQELPHIDKYMLHLLHIYVDKVTQIMHILNDWVIPVIRVFNLVLSITSLQHKKIVMSIKNFIKCFKLIQTKIKNILFDIFAQ